MIREDDFSVEFDQTPEGVSVRVTHKTTGNTKFANHVAANAVGKTCNRFISELRSMLFDVDDVRIDVGRTEEGDFLRVVHIPSGIERWAMCREGRTTEDLLDDVLEEVFARQDDA